MLIGNFLSQPGGYKAFIPAQFPPKKPISIDYNAILANDAARGALSKLDGVAQLIPDIDFFTYMYVRKEAALSSNIEGTKATMHDSLKADIRITQGIPRDVENIIHYITALKYGLDRLKDTPLTLRVIRDVHNKLMKGTTEGFGKAPGEFRTTQNWIGGTRPDNAEFVPPPPYELARCLGDFEKFINTAQPYPPLIKAALMHAQFETIHPFLDGNGRTGRLLITLELCHNKILDYPILYLSEYFKRHRDTYFSLLSDYHNKSAIDRWLVFFLEGIREVAEQAIVISKDIVKLREEDMSRVHSLGSKQAASAVKLLTELFKQPVVDVAAVSRLTGLSRPSANALVRKFVEIGILEQSDTSVTYGRIFYYAKYMKIFD